MALSGATRGPLTHSFIITHVHHNVLPTVVTTLAKKYVFLNEFDKKLMHDVHFFYVTQTEVYLMHNECK